MKQPLASQTVQCTVCGAEKTFSVYGPPGTTIRDLRKFERALQAEADEVLVQARAWAKEHEHGATERGLGQA